MKMEALEINSEKYFDDNKGYLGFRVVCLCVLGGGVQEVALNGC